MTKREGSASRRSVVASALTRFALLSIGALIVVGLGIGVASRRIALDEAVRGAREQAREVAEDVAAPLMDARVRGGDRAAVQTLATAMRHQLDAGSISHVLIWVDDDTIAWSDERTLAGRRVASNPDVRALMGTRGSLVHLPGEREPHPGLVPDDDQLLEVYVGARDADGVPFVFEAYVPPERLESDRAVIFRDLLPMGLGGLLLFQLALVPLAVGLARRVDRARRSRAEILTRSLSAWHVERRHLAQDLHDGVIQDLSGAGYALPAVIAALPDDGTATQARETGRRVTEMLARDVEALRSVILDLFPSDLSGPGLGDALQGLASARIESGLEVRIDLPAGLDLDAAVAGLVYRVVREGLLNVERHAAAQHAWVSVTQDRDDVLVEVADDGRGLSSRPTGLPRGDQTSGEHVGLLLLSAVVTDIGGRLDLVARPEGGAALAVRLPVRVPG